MFALGKGASSALGPSVEFGEAGIKIVDVPRLNARTIIANKMMDRNI